jgi:hypothetical protein
MRMGKVLVVALCLAGPAFALAQNVMNDTLASVLAYWEPGDQRSYHVVRERTGPRPGRSTYTIAFKVLDATDSTYVLECLFNNMTTDATLPEAGRDRAVFQRLLAASNGLRIVCTTDETGIPEALANRQEVEEHARQVMAGILDLALNPEERRQMQHALGPVIDADALAQDALEDIGNILFPFGVAYITGRKEEVQSEVANPLGGEPFRTQQEFTMTHLDSSAHTARMRMVQHIDPKAIDDDIEELLDSSGGEGLNPEGRELLRRTIEGITINETMDINVDLRGAWTTRLVFVRETTVRGVQEVDKRTYTLQPKRP